MCELMGMSANTPTDVCFSFTGLIRRSGDTGPHKDGWGITFYEKDRIRQFKEVSPGVESTTASRLRHYPIKSEIVISHIRQANVGGVEIDNTHPFSRELHGKTWTYAHNGQLENYLDIPLCNISPVGTTDSEYAFCHISEQLKEANVDLPDAASWAEIVADCCNVFRRKGVFNILLSDGDSLFAHCSTKLFWITRRAPFGRAHLCDEDVTIDFSQVTTQNDVVTVIATNPLTDDEQWQEMLPGECNLFKNGERIWFKQLADHNDSQASISGNIKMNN